MRNKRLEKENSENIGRKLFAAGALRETEIERIAAREDLFAGVLARVNSAPAPEVQSAALQGRQPHLADLRLLVVDDNPTNCRILTLQAGKWGMIPRAAQNAAQGRRAIGTSRNRGRYGLSPSLKSE